MLYGYFWGVCLCLQTLFIYMNTTLSICKFTQVIKLSQLGYLLSYSVCLLLYLSYCCYLYN